MKKTNTKRQAKYLVGVDVGGSKIMAGLFTTTLRLVDSVKIATEVQRGTEQVVQRIVDCVKGLVGSRGLQMHEVVAVGVGTPGIINMKTGMVVMAPNLHWKNLPLRQRLSKALKRPVFVANDCTVAMEGIYELELKKKPRNAFGIFMGTGLGGALVLDGAVYSGSSSIAGEVGHMVVERHGPMCPCGSQGCFEVFASRTGIAERLRTAMRAGETTVLEEVLHEDARQPGSLRSEHLRTAMKQGDKLAQRIVHEAAEYTGIAVASLINMLSPEVVVLGGGLIDTLHREIMPVVNEQVRSRALLRFLRKPQVFPTRLGDRAGITGAAVMARRRSS